MMKINIFLIMFFLLGCVAETVPPIQNYTLETEYSAPVSSRLLHRSQVIKITPVKALSEYTRRDIIYSNQDNQLNSYAYSRWNDAPVKLFENIIQQKLENSGLFKAVISSSSFSRADLLLESRLLDFRQKGINQGASTSIVRVRFYLVNAANRSVTDSKEFTATVPLKTVNARGAVDALNQASNQIADKLVKWLTENPQRLGQQAEKKM